MAGEGSRERARASAGASASADIFPWAAYLATVGALLGGAIAGGIEAYRGGGVIVATALGAIAGGSFGLSVGLVLARAERTGRGDEETEPAADHAPAAAPAVDLYDPWLDVVAGSAKGPVEAIVIGARAVVRPRVLSPGGTTSTPLVEEVAVIAGCGHRGAIRLEGPPGSGKSTALAHLADALADATMPVTLVDNARAETVARAQSRGLVVYTAGAERAHRRLATLRLAPWVDDDLVEYLAANHRERCGSVLARLKGAKDKGWLEGIAELWAPVLDRLVYDDSLRTIKDALRRELRERLASDELAGAVRLACIDLLHWPGMELRGIIADLRARGADREALRLMRHRPAQLLLAAEGMIEVLEGDRPPGFLRESLPRDLVREAGACLSPRPQALRRLRAIAGRTERRGHWQATAASLLLAAGDPWRPEPGTSPNLAGAFLDHAPWAGVDLAGADLKCADLNQADLAGARLSGAQAHRARFRRVNLRGATLSDLVAEEADFSGADLTAAQATRARLGKADLTDALCARANFRLADLRGATIAGADFQGADLGDAMLNGLVLTRADFRGADLGGAGLSRCDLEGIELPDACLRAADLRRALLTGSKLPGADLAQADLRDAGLAEIDWEGADLRDADLRGASFHLGSSRGGLVGSPIACEGSRTGFYTDDYHDRDFKAPEEVRKANLRGADLRGARIDGVDFYLVDLRDARIDPSQSRHLLRCGAILRERC
ncbi:MAG TPA: pentapeptide repeat-containing protein [Isosphaeraceae bacterium]|jgi:uncharacterized protein YjbI with pentapeptide repeats|nr:pentapeptide repeat-containing protein [Isosphaeraceae bacterium]